MSDRPFDEVAPSEARRMEASAAVERANDAVDQVQEAEKSLNAAVQHVLDAIAAAPPEAGMELADANVNIHHALARVRTGAAIVSRIVQEAAHGG